MADTDAAVGLSNEEAAKRLAQDGKNEVPTPKRRPLFSFLRKLSGPVPWMLEGALVLEVILGKWVEAADVRSLVMAGAALASGWLLFSFAIIFVARNLLHYALPELQTLVFLVLVFTGQATVYLLRERRRFWRSRPGTWMLVASTADILVVSWMAIQGVLIAPLAAPTVVALPVAVAAFAILLDQIKVVLFRSLRLLGT